MMNKQVILSIVVVSNNKESLKSMLLSSLQIQSFNDYELIVVDGKLYTSASEAYNAGAEKAKGTL